MAGDPERVRLMTERAQQRAAAIYDRPGLLGEAIADAIRTALAEAYIDGYSDAISDQLARITEEGGST